MQARYVMPCAYTIHIYAQGNREEFRFCSFAKSIQHRPHDKKLLLFRVRLLYYHEQYLFVRIGMEPQFEHNFLGESFVNKKKLETQLLVS